MNEDFLHYVWKYQTFTERELKCKDGEPLQVLKPGMHNMNAGPDFLNARIRIGDTVWAGNIEIHTNASDWYNHNHQSDPAYDNVILHVVYTADKPVLDKSGHEIPVLTLKDLIDYQTYRYYKSWVKQAKFIACEGLLNDVPDIVKTSAIQAAAVERLQMKSEDCLDLLRTTNGDIEETFYRIFCKAIGLKVNAMPFEQLAIITPFSLVRKNRKSAEELQALLLGQAGFLDEAENGNAFIDSLKKTYSIQQIKHQLSPMPASAWKLFRLRPPNFPAVRIAQMAEIYSSHNALAQQLIELKTVDGYEEIFKSVLDKNFWLTHYTLKAESEPAVKRLGKSTVHLLIINAVVPFLFALANYNKDGSFQEKAVSLLEQLPAESNQIIKKYNELGFKAQNAFDSQGLIGLKKNYCEQLRCLNCKVGIQILKNHGKAH